MRGSLQFIALSAIVLFYSLSLQTRQVPARIMERLGRGVVVIPLDSSRVFVSWRMLGTEPEDIAFNLYRKVGNQKPVRVNKSPLFETNFVDENVDLSKPIA